MKPTVGKFEAALKDARLAEAAHLDAIVNLQDAKSLRLLALRDKLLPELSGHPALTDFVELKLLPGETPRLWIDLISSVVMEPNSRNFRLEQDREQHRDILFETDNMDQMADQVIKYVAHRVISRQKAAVPLASLRSFPHVASYGLGAVLYVWATGFIFGAAALAILAIYLGKLVF